MSNNTPMTQQRLLSYLSLAMERDNRLDRLHRLESEAQLPPMRESDGSQHTAGRGDRMEKAIIRYTEYKNKIGPIIAAINAELDAIDEAIDALADPLEREVLRMRYTEGDTCQQMKWSDVCIRIYGNDNESRMRSLSDIHKRALSHLRAN